MSDLKDTDPKNVKSKNNDMTEVAPNIIGLWIFTNQIQTSFFCESFI